ncbi:MAG TPA: hypothetical protein PKK42_20065, partial [Leptospiraceae bacterium]|nr:hypothetical protein [Leptospiraceae bacterium]
WKIFSCNFILFQQIQQRVSLRYIQVTSLALLTINGLKIFPSYRCLSSPSVVIFQILCYIELK